MSDLIMKGFFGFRNAFRSFLKKEKGASDMVAVIVLIVIIIAVAAIFREQLVKIVQNVMKDLENATKQ